MSACQRPPLHAPHLLDLNAVAYELVVPRRVSVDVIHAIDQFDLKRHRRGVKVSACRRWRLDYMFGRCADQVVECGALLLSAHVFEEAMVGHQQQRTGVLQVVVHLTLPSEH